jgi:hypothetical protein
MRAMAVLWVMLLLALADCQSAPEPRPQTSARYGWENPCLNIEGHAQRHPGAMGGAQVAQWKCE